MQTGAGLKTLSILVLPDAANSIRANSGLPDIYYIIPEVPQVARDPTGKPVFSLSLVLRGQPGPENDSIFELIDSGSFAFDLTLGIPDGLDRGMFMPLYVRQADFQLLNHTDKEQTNILGEFAANGAGIRLGISLHLDRSTAKGILVALQKGNSGISLSCRLKYLTANSSTMIHLHIHWTDVYDYLYSKMGHINSLSNDLLQDYLIEMMKTGVIKAWKVQPSGLEVELTTAEGPALLEAFLKVSSTLLMSATPESDLYNTEKHYILRDRPDETSNLDIRLSTTTTTERIKDLESPLEAIIGGILDGQNADDFIHLSYVDPTSIGGIRSLPRRMRSEPLKRDGLSVKGGSMTGLAVVGEHVVSMTRALMPDSNMRPMTHMLLASNIVHQESVAKTTFKLDNIIFEHFHEVGANAPIPNIPLVGDSNAALWPDYAHVTQFWYPPEFVLDPVNPAVDPNTSPFLFTFHEVGHDEKGNPVLEGEVLFTIRRSISNATQTALQAISNSNALPVPTLGLSITLSLPLRDNTGQLRYIDLPADVRDNGDTITIRIALLNEYVRVAYGDLAISGFQPSLSKMKIAYTFEAMVLAEQTHLALQFAGKLSLTPVAYSNLEVNKLEGKPYFDATQITYRSARSDLSFRLEAPSKAFANREKFETAKEEPSSKNGIYRSILSMTMGDKDTFNRLDNRLVSATSTGVHALQLTTVVRPQMEIASNLQSLLRQKHYAKQTQVHVSEIDIYYPCETLGTFYQQDLGDRVISIGCQNSFSLGQTSFKLYELVDDPSLVSPYYQIYRSLCQPGRFLVLPAAYRITRYPPSEGERAYRPIVYLYSSLDASNESNNRCVVMASLQADLMPWVRKDLEIKLTRLHHTPRIEYVTELNSELTYTWSISGGISSIQPQAAKLWDSFQITLSTDLTGGIQLQSMLSHGGVSAQVLFKLADGTTLSTSLQIDLANMTGPFVDGPLQTIIEGTTVKLTNRIKGGLNVSDLMVYGTAVNAQTIRVDRLLQLNDSITVELPVGFTEAYPIYTLQMSGPAEITEVTSFVEDIHTNVVFVNLVNYQNHNLKSLSLQVRIKEVPGSETSKSISEEQPVSEVPFILPLTTYLDARTLQYLIKKTDTSDNITSTNWIDWDLKTHGNVISITWDLIQ